MFDLMRNNRFDGSLVMLEHGLQMRYDTIDGDLNTGELRFKEMVW